MNPRALGQLPMGAISPGMLEPMDKASPRLTDTICQRL